MTQLNGTHRAPAKAAPRPARHDHRTRQIAEAAAQSDLSEEKLRLLITFEQQAAARAARTNFDRAFSVMQPELPPILKRPGTSGDPTAPSYAHWEDINEAIKPILKAHGFALRFRTAQDLGTVTVTCLLGHVDGHVEETTLRLPLDLTGGKNPVQAVGSTASYGKRYTASALLNLTAIGEDDDGSGRGAVESLSEEQVARLRQLLETSGADEGKLLGLFKARSLEALPAKYFSRALALLRAKAVRQ